MAIDMINHPAHYAGHYTREVIELAEQMNFCNGNAVKYILRSPWKGREVEDLQKAIWYVKRQQSSGLDEYFDVEIKAIFRSFLGDLAEQGRLRLYRALLALMEHDYRDAIDALEEAINAANDHS